jgi:hypothetical protein
MKLVDRMSRSAMCRHRDGETLTESKRCFMKVIFTSGLLFAATTVAAYAQAKPVDVPEISALEGTAALAVVAALVLLVWERRRRAA